MHDISVIIAMNRRAERSRSVYRMAHDGRGHARLVRVIHTSPQCHAVQDHAECPCTPNDDQRYHGYKRSVPQETTDPEVCQPCHGTGTVELDDQLAQCVDCQGTGRLLTGPGPLDPDNEAPNPADYSDEPEDVSRDRGYIRDMREHRANRDPERNCATCECECSYCHAPVTSCVDFAALCDPCKMEIYGRLRDEDPRRPTCARCNAPATENLNVLPRETYYCKECTAGSSYQC